MGGNAFQGTVRLTAAEHARLKQRVLDALAHHSIAHTLDVVASAEVLDKASFGDVDLYAAPRAPFDADQVRRHMTHLVVQALHCPVPPARNGSTVSFLAAERYQVDIAFTDAAKLSLYAAVHSNGDFAVLLQISLSAVGLRLTTEGFFLRDERLVGNGRSKRDASFLLSLDPAKVGAFLGLPREAFDGRTSVAMSRLFELVVENGFFDGGAVAAWMGCESGEIQSGGKTRRSRRRVRERPMLITFRDWWTATGMALHGHREPAHPCGSFEGARELAVEFFDKRAQFRAWEAQVTQKLQVAERGTACKSSLSFAVVKGWLPDSTSREIGAVLRKIRADHGQYGSVELFAWVKGMSREDLRSEALAVARQLGGHQRIRYRDEFAKSSPFR